MNEAKPTASMPAAYPSTTMAWYMVGILMVMYVFSFIDRQILGLLVGPIRQEFGISDTQVGVLQGPIFALFYCTLGIPIGWLADKFSRRWIVAIGVFLWSLMATFCGLARNYWELLAARLGVGVGEAALSPAAYSMITDSFPKQKLGRAFGVYNMGIALGSGLALIAGGIVVNLVSGGDSSYTLPIIGEVRAWQIVFIATGAPGILLCLLAFTFREPARRGLLQHTAGTNQSVGIGQTIAFIKQRFDFFGPFFIGVGLLSIVGYGYLGWLPSALHRKFDVPIGNIGIINGYIVLIFNTFGIFTAGWICDRITSRGRQDAAVYVCIFIACSTMIFGTLTPLMPTLTSAYICLAIFNLTISAYTGLVPLAVNLITPNQMRGQASAIYLLINNMIGLGVGPVLMPFVSDYIIGDENKVYLSISVVTACCAATAAVIFILILPRYRARIIEAGAWHH